MRLVYGLTLLLGCQLAGEVGVHALGIPVPGPVLGMFLLLLGLVLAGAVGASADQAANALLTHLSLLFVPAGVGIMVYLDRLGDAWVPILLTLLLSTLLTMAVTAWTMQWLMGRFGTGADQDG
jgi:holin-like protein